MINGQIRSVIPWSRILSDQEILLAMNTDTEQAKTAWVTIDLSKHIAGEKLSCIYSTDTTQIGNQVEVEPRNGLSVQITVPPAGFVIYE